MLKISSGDGRASLRFSQLSTNLFILHAHRRGKTVCKLFGGRQQSPRCERAMPNLTPPLVPCSCRFLPQVSSASVHQAFQMMRCRKSALPRLCSAVVLLDSSACTRGHENRPFNASCTTVDKSFVRNGADLLHDADIKVM